MSNETPIFPDGVPSNSADFFDKPLIKPTGFREYDVRWRLEGGEEPELNYSGLTVLGKAFGSWLFEHLDGFDVVIGASQVETVVGERGFPGDAVLFLQQVDGDGGR